MREESQTALQPQYELWIYDLKGCASFWHFLNQLLCQRYFWCSTSFGDVIFLKLGRNTPRFGNSQLVLCYLQAYLSPHSSTCVKMSWKLLSQKYVWECHLKSLSIDSNCASIDTLIRLINWHDCEIVDLKLLIQRLQYATFVDRCKLIRRNDFFFLAKDC